MRSRLVKEKLVGRLSLSSWGVVLVFMALTAFERLLFGRAIAPSPTLFLFLGALILGTLFLGPIPWQWTGDERKMLALLRGTAHALVFDLGWVAVLAGLFIAAERLRGWPGRYPPRLLETARILGVHPLVLIASVALPLIYLFGWFIAEREAAESEKSEALQRQRVLKESLKDVEARVLQAELDPHVLYNALGALAELARRDPARTEQALLDFSDYYRRVTACARSRTITLADERELLELFLGIEQLRLGDRMRVLWRWPEALEAFRIPPLLLQPVVENAIRHGLAPSEAGGELHLEARQEGRDLVLRIENDGQALAEPFRPGTGLSNLLRRLQTLDPPGAFSLGRVAERTRAELRLPLEDRP